MMTAMFETDGVHIDCHTCVAANTTACNDCLVTHLLANDAGPIDLVLAGRPARPTPVELVIERFTRAGLLDDPPVFVAPDDFAAGRVGALLGV